ncbi:hypothetical protein ABT040_12585 [Streptomyces sp. NPDC002688]|uniref:hypothetical protein n=1 Tax=Streptomyces sp. NPDC002688 TaxID=3154423 RepID=UPI00332985B0
MTRTKKAFVTAAIAVAAAIGASVPAFANTHVTDTPITTDNTHVTDTPVTTDNTHVTVTP